EGGTGAVLQPRAAPRVERTGRGRSHRLRRRIHGEAISSRSDVRLVPFRRGVPVRVAGDRLLVMQSMLPATIHEELQPDAATRLLFWTLHPMNFVQALAPFAWARDIQARFPSVTRAAGRIILRRFARELQTFVG